MGTFWITSARLPFFRKMIQNIPVLCLAKRLPGSFPYRINSAHLLYNPSVFARVQHS